MVDNKTGGFFRLALRLMEAEASIPSMPPSLLHLITLLGRYYQIRDDYQNLASDEVSGPLRNLLPFIYLQSSAYKLMSSTLLRKASATISQKESSLFRLFTCSNILLRQTECAACYFIDHKATTFLQRQSPGYFLRWQRQVALLTFKTFSQECTTRCWKLWMILRLNLGQTKSWDSWWLPWGFNIQVGKRTLSTEGFIF